MLRRPKEDKAQAPAEPQDALVAPETENPIDERLAPLEEFRSKSDQWMKETSAQLARVATHVQQDEKRQQKLDSRLAEFEDRIQAMLTLTEALSMGENPFVKRRGDPEDAAPEPHEPLRDTEPRRSDANGNRPPHPVWGKEVEGEPAEAEIVRLEPPSHAQEDAREGLAAPLRGHPNDATLESYSPDNPFVLPEPDAEAPPPRAITAKEMDDSPRLDEDAADEAERRLLLLQWSGLLARHMHRIDIDAFLETYLRTGWVVPADVEKVRALAADLARHAPPPGQRLSREDLHIRTILLLSRLATRAERGGRHARRLVDETRNFAQAPWLSDER